MAEIHEEKLEPKPDEPSIKLVDAAKAERLRDERELPKKPGNTVTMSDWEQWVALLSPPMEKRLDIYVYRTVPFIVNQRKNPDLPNYIDVICGDVQGVKHVNNKWLGETHGYGDYSLWIIDRDKKAFDKKGDNQNKIFDVKARLPLGQYAFLVDPEVVVWEAKENISIRAWARAHGIIDEKNMPIEANKNQGGNNNNNSDITAMMKLMLDHFTRLSERDQISIKKELGGEAGLSKSIGDILLERMKQDDPMKLITTMSALMQAMKPDAKSDSSLGFMQMIMESNKQMLTILMETQKQSNSMMLEAIKGLKEDKPAGGTSTKVEELSAILDIADRISDRSGNPGKRDWRELAIEKGAEVLVPSLGLISQLIALKTGGAQPQQTRPQPQATGPMSNAREQARVAQQLPSPTANQPEQAPEVNEAQQLISQFGPMIISNLDKDGCDVGNMIANFLPQGNLLMATMRRMGVDSIIEGAKGVPEFWQQVSGTYGEPKLREWVDEMLRYDEILAELEEEDDTKK